MNNGGKLILAGAGMIGLFYLPTLLALRKLTWSPYRLIVRGVSGDSITLEILLQVSNASGVNLTLQDARLEVWLNGYHAGSVTDGVFARVPAHGVGIVSAVVTVHYSDVLKATWNSLLDGRLATGQTLAVTGWVKLNNKGMRLSPITFGS